MSRKKGKLLIFLSLYALAYILSLSVAINNELKKTKLPVRVVTICIGATQKLRFLKILILKIKKPCQV
ncbi:hypothetical protein [Spiroplasma kunkelii]|uniref:hypothetical protein n=1 Tax=Spiroplasma kunkelii TaxID=47834 RepID=UPI001F2CB61D|nr:hypothetical protein [Spiroplasma kunkelii]